MHVSPSVYMETVFIRDYLLQNNSFWWGKGFMSDEQKNDLIDKISKLQQRIRTLKKKKSDTVNIINTEIEQLNNNLNKLKVQLIRFDQDKE